MPQIQVSSSVYQRLLRHSTSFDDTPDVVIERLLDRAERKSNRGIAPSTTAEAPASSGSILPEGEYWLPILGIVDEAGGSAPANHVIDALEERMGDALKERDRETLSNGEVRWRNRARFARLRMKERGLLSNGSQRGIWEITNVGRAYLKLNRSQGKHRA